MGWGESLSPAPQVRRVWLCTAGHHVLTVIESAANQHAYHPGPCSAMTSDGECGLPVAERTTSEVAE